MTDLWSQLFSFANYGELLVLVRNSILAGAVLGLAGGLVGVFVMARDLPFAVHAISELSFPGGAGGAGGVARRFGGGFREGPRPAVCRARHQRTVFRRRSRGSAVWDRCGGRIAGRIFDRGVADRPSWISGPRRE